MAKGEFEIDPRFSGLMPPLTSEKFELLRDNIKRDGKILKPLAVWKQANKLLDGHHRKKISDKLGIGYRVEYINLKDDAEAVNWIIEHQDGQRDWTDMIRAETALRAKDVLAQIARENMAKGGRKEVKEGLPNLANLINTREKIAEAAGVSSGTISNVEKIIESGSKSVADMARAGDISISAAAKISELPKSEQSLIARRGPDAVKERAAELRRPSNGNGHAKIKRTPRIAIEEIPKDDLGYELDAELHEPFSARETFDEVLNHLTAISRLLNPLLGDPQANKRPIKGGEFLAHDRQQILTHLKTARADIGFGRPYAPCPYPHHDDHVCIACKGIGWLTEQSYNASPREYRKASK